MFWRPILFCKWSTYEFELHFARKSFTSEFSKSLNNRMVEGPGVRLNAEKLRRSVLNKVVSSVTANALNPDLSAQLLGKCLQTILPLGKELFLFFLATQNQESPSETCLRLHFGMSGSALINSAHRFKKTPVLEIQFDSCTVLRLYETTLETRNASATRAKFERLQSFDVCSQARCRPTFTRRRAGIRAAWQHTVCTLQLRITDRHRLSRWLTIIRRRRRQRRRSLDSGGG